MGWGPRRGGCQGGEKQEHSSLHPSWCMLVGNSIRRREAHRLSAPDRRAAASRASSPRLPSPSWAPRARAGSLNARWLYRLLPFLSSPPQPSKELLCAPGLRPGHVNASTQPPLPPRKTAQRAARHVTAHVLCAPARTPGSPPAAHAASCRWRGARAGGGRSPVCCQPKGPAVYELRPRRSATARSAEGPSQAHPCGDSTLLGTKTRPVCFLTAQVLF